MKYRVIDLSDPKAREEYHRELEKMKKKEYLKDVPLKAAIIFFFGYGLISFGVQILNLVVPS